MSKGMNNTYWHLYLAETDNNPFKKTAIFFKKILEFVRKKHYSYILLFIL